MNVAACPRAQAPSCFIPSSSGTQTAPGSVWVSRTASGRSLQTEGVFTCATFLRQAASLSPTSRDIFSPRKRSTLLRSSRTHTAVQQTEGGVPASVLQQCALRSRQRVRSAMQPVLLSRQTSHPARNRGACCQCCRALVGIERTHVTCFAKSPAQLLHVLHLFERSVQ